MNTHVLVRNVAGTSDLGCECGSWLQHWLNNGGSETRVTCAALECLNAHSVGAHVVGQDERADGSWWIIPVCSEHNMETEPYWVTRQVAFAPANTQETGCYLRAKD